MKKIYTIVSLILVSIMAYSGAPKSVIYEEANSWFSLDTDGTDSVGNNFLLVNNINFISDTDRGSVAEFTTANSSGLESLLPLVNNNVYTITMWIKVNMDNFPIWRQIYEFHNTVTGSNQMLTGKIDWGQEYGAVFDKKSPNRWQSVQSGQAFPTRNWAHLALSFNYGDVAIYLNGLNVAEGYTDNLIDSIAPNKFLFGAFSIPTTGRNSNGLDCLMDDIAVFNKVLTSDKILAMAKDTLPVRPNVEPFVFEAEDYSYGNWMDASENDTSYSYFNGTANDLFPSTEHKLQYGYYIGDGIYTLWARVKNDVAVDSAFMIKINNTDWRACNTLGIEPNWNWVNLYQTNAIPNGNHTIEIAPGKNNVKVDKFLITADWGMDPNVEYAKTDNEEPTTPGTLQVMQVGANSAILLWSISSDNTEVTAYDVFESGKPMYITNTYGIQPELIASTNYSFKIRAKDAAGNVSEFTNVVEATTEDLTFTLDFGNPKQTVHHFGSSDAWAVENLYKWPLSKREDMVEKLFSTELDAEGNPKGIGLSQWRFKIGDGSLEQSNSGYRTGAWFRELECFMNPDGTYDWTKQAGSRWFLKKAKEYGVNAFVGWTDSPPYYMTKNGYTFRTSDVNGYNLQTDKYDDYTEFFATVIKHFVDSGYNFEVASPVNEPQWAWVYEAGDAIQSGSKVSNDELHTVADNLSTKLYEKGVNTKVMVSEAGAIDYLYAREGSDAGNQIDYFWNTDNATSLVHKPSFGKMVAGHSYWTNNTLSGSIGHRNEVRDRLKALNNNLEYWQTEYSLLGEAHREGRKVSEMEVMDYAVWLSRIIHIDLTEGDCASWSYWSTFTRAGGNTDHRHRFGLFWWIPDVDNMTNTDGQYYDMKQMWAYGNYSRFIRPESKRIEVTRGDGESFVRTASEEFLSAYYSQDTSQLIIVATNYAARDQKITIDITNLMPGLSVGEFTPYVTSKTDNLKAYPAVGANSAIYLPAKSVVTLVGEINKDINSLRKINKSNESNFVKIMPNPAKDAVTFKFNEPTSGKITISNPSGKQVYRITINNTTNHTINISHLNAGIYIAHFSQNGIVHTQKLVKQ